MTAAATIFASELVTALQLSLPIHPTQIAHVLGLTVRYCDASGFEGALVCSKESRLGTILVRDSIREDGRKKFTIAHEIGHYVLPHHGTSGSVCSTSEVESWDKRLPEQEREANVFAGELLMPRSLMDKAVESSKPSFDLIRDLASTFSTSLTATAFRVMSLTHFRAAIVWSTQGMIRWFKASEEFSAFVQVRERVMKGTYAYDCYNGIGVPHSPKSVRAPLWLAPSRGSQPDYVLEHSIFLSTYKSVLTLLLIEEPSISLVDNDEEALTPLDPKDFTLNRRRWPR